MEIFGELLFFIAVPNEKCVFLLSVSLCIMCFVLFLLLLFWLLFSLYHWFSAI